MVSTPKPRVAIVDYGMGNLHSIERACKISGLSASITSSPSDIHTADGVILPGVGAFGDAMEALRKSRMVDALHNVAASNKPLFGVCLGLQLLMTESVEFGKHKGLGIVSGRVLPFDKPIYKSVLLKVPHVGWSRVWKARSRGGQSGSSDPWQRTPLGDLNDGAYMYFVHSYYVVPEDSATVVSTTRYGNVDFCSSLCYKNIFAFQFHPERSGSQGLHVYKRMAEQFS